MVKIRMRDTKKAMKDEPKIYRNAVERAGKTVSSYEEMDSIDKDLYDFIRRNYGAKDNKEKKAKLLEGINEVADQFGVDAKELKTNIDRVAKGDNYFFPSYEKFSRIVNNLIAHDEDKRQFHERVKVASEEDRKEHKQLNARLENYSYRDLATEFEWEIPFPLASKLSEEQKEKCNEAWENAYNSNHPVVFTTLKVDIDNEFIPNREMTFAKHVDASAAVQINNAQFDREKNSILFDVFFKVPVKTGLMENKRELNHAIGLAFKRALGSENAFSALFPEKVVEILTSNIKNGEKQLTEKQLKEDYEKTIKETDKKEGGKHFGFVDPGEGPVVKIDNALSSPSYAAGGNEARKIFEEFARTGYLAGNKDINILPSDEYTPSSEILTERDWERLASYIKNLHPINNLIDSVYEKVSSSPEAKDLETKYEDQKKAAQALFGEENDFSKKINYFVSKNQKINDATANLKNNLQEFYDDLRSFKEEFEQSPRLYASSASAEKGKEETSNRGGHSANGNANRDEWRKIPSINTDINEYSEEIKRLVARKALVIAHKLRAHLPEIIHNYGTIKDYLEESMAEATEKSKEGIEKRLSNKSFDLKAIKVLFNRLDRIADTDRDLYSKTYSHFKSQIEKEFNAVLDDFSEISKKMLDSILKVGEISVENAKEEIVLIGDYFKNTTPLLSSMGNVNGTVAMLQNSSLLKLPGFDQYVSGRRESIRKLNNTLREMKNLYISMSEAKKKLETFQTEANSKANSKANGKVYFKDRNAIREKILEMSQMMNKYVDLIDGDFSNLIEGVKNKNILSALNIGEEKRDDIITGYRVKFNRIKNSMARFYQYALSDKESVDVDENGKEEVFVIPSDFNERMIDKIFGPVSDSILESLESIEASKDATVSFSTKYPEFAQLIDEINSSNEKMLNEISDLKNLSSILVPSNLLNELREALQAFSVETKAAPANKESVPFSVKNLSFNEDEKEEIAKMMNRFSALANYGKRRKTK